MITKFFKKDTSNKKTESAASSHVPSAPQQTGAPAAKPKNTTPPSPAGKEGGHSHKRKPNTPPPRKQNRPHPQKKEEGSKQGVLKTYIIGGLNEVGKNCLALEYNNDIIMVDVGMAFPDDEMLGVDFVIPDTAFLEKNKHKIRGVVITHGHLDHIGALQHVLPKIGFPPIITTKLTAGLITKRLEEYGIMKQCHIHIVDPEKDTFKLGNFDLEFFPVNHSIPDCMGVYGKTPAGTFVHTGDFKFDFTPTDGKPANVGRMAEIGKKGVDVIYCESTNARKEGYCKSEKIINENLHEVISKAKGRIILASFSSLVSRIEQIVHYATKYNRKVFVSGRSMQNTLEIAARLRHFKVPKGSIRRLSPATDDMPAEQVLILTTGSQGEPRSALTRIANGTHSQIAIHKGDTVVFSSSPIPGNERGVANTINNLILMGANVITNDTMDIHVSGHGHAGDIQMMHCLMKPKYIVPIHGEMFMRQAHKEIALNLGYAPENVPLLENGSILEFEKGHIRKSKSKIPADVIMIDGLGSGDIGTRVMEERKIMSQGGIILIAFKAFDKSHRLVGDPDVMSRGFIYMRESKEILRDVQNTAKKAYEKYQQEANEFTLKGAKKAVTQAVQTLIYRRVQREPMILPMVMMV